MDVVDLPLPENVAVSTLLAADGFGTGEIEAADDSAFGRLPATGGSCSTRDITNRVTEQRPIPVKRADVELCLHGSLHPSLDSAWQSANKSSLLMPNLARKQLLLKAGKRSRSSGHCLKRPRTGQAEDSTRLFGADSSGSNMEKCTPTVVHEKARVVKHKHGQDGKRGVKRCFRASVSSKFDTSLKASFLSSNSAGGGNNILGMGMYGLRSDMNNLMKYVDELSLNELLSGNYRSPNFCQDKGKKPSNMNENIIHSVRKVCSILSLRGTVESRNVVDLNSSRRVNAYSLGPSSCVTSDNRENSMADLGSSNKANLKGDCFSLDHGTANEVDIHGLYPVSTFHNQGCGSELGAFRSLNDSILYKPKDILEWLALPQAKDLDALLLSTPMPPVPFEMTDWHSGIQTCHRASLPPFTWSLSHNGPSKLTIDCGKLFTHKGTSQVRWCRIGSNTSFIGNVTSSFSDLNLVIHDPTGVASAQLNINGTSGTKTARPPYYGQVSCSYSVTHTPPSYVSDKLISKKGSGFMSFPERHVDSSDGYQQLEHKDLLFLTKLEDEDSLKYQGNEASFMGSWRNNFLLQETKGTYSEMKQCPRTPGGCSDENMVGRYSQHFQQIPQRAHASSDGHSPRMLAAAQILCEIASDSDVMGNQDGNRERFRLPEKPSQKAMKACNSRSIMGKQKAYLLHRSQ